MNMEKKGNMDEYIDRLIRELPGVHTYEDGQSWHKGTYEGLAAFAKILIEYGIELGHTEAEVDAKLVEVHSRPLDEAAEEYFNEIYEHNKTKTNKDWDTFTDGYRSAISDHIEDAFKRGAIWQRNHDIQGRSVDIESGKEIMKMEMMKDEMNLKFKEGEFNDKGVEQLVQDYIGDDDIGDDLGDILDGFGRYLRDRGLLKGTEPANDDLEKYKEFVASELPQGSKVSQNGEFTIDVVKTLIKDAVKMGVEWQKDQMIKDYRWMTPHKTKMIQKSWYLEGWHDHKYNQNPQFEPGPDLEQKYRPCHMTGDEVQELCNRNYENGKKDKEEEIMKDAIHCKVFWHDGPLLDYTQEQQDDVLEKIGAEVGDKVKLIIVKDNE